MNGFNKPLRLETVLKMDDSAEERGNPQPHELAEDVAERQSVEKVQGMKDAFVFEVSLDFLFHRVESGEHIAMGVNNALRLRGCARGEEDLKRCVERQVGLSQAGLRFWRQGGPTILEAEAGQAFG